MMKDLLRSPVLAAMLFLAGIVVLVSGNANGTLYKWSQTAATNSTADATINWAEGMAPSAVNDSARAMMAAVAKWRDDMAGATATGGSSNAYTLTSNQVFASLSVMSGQRVCFLASFTNTSSATLNVDSLGAKSLHAQTGVELVPGAIVSGSSYCATYNNSTAAWIVAFHNINTSLPLGGIIDFAGTSVPGSNFAIARGAAISRTTYAGLFALIGTTWGAGDGFTTFNLPDLGGRVTAGSEASESRLTSAVSGCNGASIGATCGGQAVTLAAGNIPTLTSGNFGHSLSVNTSITNGSAVPRTNNVDNIQPCSSGCGTTVSTVPKGVTIDTLSLNSGSVSGSITYTNGSQSDVVRVQPTIIINKLIRIL